eukprot:4989627-Pleurochrysis_carterae.AAC.1
MTPGPALKPRPPWAPATGAGGEVHGSPEDWQGQRAVDGERPRGGERHGRRRLAASPARTGHPLW